MQTVETKLIYYALISMVWNEMSWKEGEKLVAKRMIIRFRFLVVVFFSFTCSKKKKWSRDDLYKQKRLSAARYLT